MTRLPTDEMITQERLDRVSKNLEAVAKIVDAAVSWREHSTPSFYGCNDYHKNLIVAVNEWNELIENGETK